MIERAFVPVDARGLATFRILFGGLMAVSGLRFLWNGWVDTLFATPAFHFRYWGFEWVPVPGAMGLKALFVANVALALLVCTGTLYRAAIALFFVTFAWIQLLDVASYLNHYYLIGLLSFLLIFLPANAAWSVDARLFPRVARAHVPALCLWVLRAQIGVVYTYAGLAKLGSDWLLHAQPLNLWLHSRAAFPVVGALLEERTVSLAMSWGGFLFDTSIPWLLSFDRTRRPAFALVVGFHLVTGLLFPIGMFPAIMVASATVFLPPDWATLGRGRALGPAAASAVTPLARGLAWAAAAWLVVQVAMPLRTHLYGGNVLWHEQGMRFSWRVMVREKNGVVAFRVEDPATGKISEVNPSKYLDEHHAREMAGQPDLILQLARRIARDAEANGHPGVKVRADAWVSLNGRPKARFIDPTVDLAHVSDGLGRFDWVLPAPTTAPIHLRALADRGPR